MRIETSEYVLQVDGDRFKLRQHTSHRNEEVWLNGRQGDLARSSVKVVANSTLKPKVYFDGKDIGYINKEDIQSLDSLCELIEYYNQQLGPTDLQTAKVATIFSKGRDLVNVTKELSVWSVTWNMFGSLSSITRDHTETLVDYANDVVVLNFQESDPLNRNLVANQQTLQLAIQMFSRDSHYLASSVQLLGLMTLVFVKKEFSIRNLEKASSGVGFLRIWGNKGAVLTRFDILSDELLGGGVEFSIVNCHLSAGESPDQNQRRQWELREISSKFKVSGVINTSGAIDTSVYEFDADVDESAFSDDERDNVPSRYRNQFGIDSDDDKPVPELPADADPPVIDTKAAEVRLDKPVPLTPTEAAKPLPPIPEDEKWLPKVTIFVGDLNYRVHMHVDSVLDLIKKGNYQTILEQDNCTRLVNDKKLLTEFYEHPISFAPTYKYKLNSHAYDNSLRTPSYTDRIFYSSQAEFKVNKYTSLDHSISDHRPVVSQASFKILTTDQKKYNDLVESAYRMVDKAENLLIPSVSITPNSIEEEVRLFSMPCITITIASESNRPINWSVAPNDKIHVSPSEGVLQARSSQRLMLKSFAGINTKEINEILIVHVEEGTDRFVSVIFHTKPSFVGQGISELCKNGDEKDNIPKQIWHCTHYLWSRVLPKIFIVEGELSIISEAIEWLENGGDLDEEVLDAANKNNDGAGSTSIARVLFIILTNLPEAVISASIIDKLDETAPVNEQLLELLPAQNANLAVYLVGFFQHILKYGCTKQNLLEPIERMLMGRSKEPETEDKRRKFISALLDDEN